MLDDASEKPIRSLMRVTKNVARGNYDRLNEIFELTKSDRYPAPNPSALPLPVKERQQASASQGQAHLLVTNESMKYDLDRSSGVDRRDFLRQVLAGALIAAFALFPKKTEAVRVFDVKSPKRRTRPRRKSTRFIILHTTEADGQGTLETITWRGTANYVVDPGGRIYRIMGKTQVSIGCGRSMWSGLTNLDNHSINVEVVGYHDRSPTRQQMDSLRYLLKSLMRSYGISAKNVMPHSQVAYGRPNRWYRRSHRGRKRCGMIFATDPVRKRLGLSDKPRYDPDVRVKRLSVADDYLEEVLYGKLGELEPSVVTAHTTPAAQDSEDEDVAVRTVEKGQTVWEYAGDEYADETTIYLLADGRIRRGDELLQEEFDFQNIQPGTRIAVGYVYGGYVTKDRTSYSIAGKNWNNPDTLYITDGKIITGDEVSDEKIPVGTLLLFRR
jgi:N-acetylmuramoyl-L-alanine amidase